MRIAIYIDSLSGGGAECTRLKVARGLIDCGHEVDFLLLSPLIHYPYEVPPTARLFVLDMDPDEMTRSVSAHHLERCIPLAPEVQTTSRTKDYLRLVGALRLSPSAWLKGYMHPANALSKNPLALPNERWLRRAQFVASYVSKENPDCILPSLSPSTIATLWATSLLSRFPPVIPTCHSVLSHSENGRAKTRYRRLLMRSTHVVTISDGVRDDVLALTGIPSHKVSTIYNPVVTHELNELKKEVPDHPWMTDGGPPVVLSVGRLQDVKDHQTLLKAFHVLARTRELRLIVLGEGGHRQRLEECIRVLGLEDSVALPGWTDNPFAFMARAALFVLSSKHEGLSRVLIEALACGCPVVSTDCPGGVSEVLENGRVGPLVPVGDHAALADAMGRVLDDPPDKEMLMRRAAFFSADKAVDAYERLIVETVRRHRSASDAGTTTERRA